MTFWAAMKEDMDFLLLEVSFKQKKILGPQINLDDLSEVECEQLFRFVFSSRQPSWSISYFVPFYASILV